MMLAAEGLSVGQVERHASVSQFDDMIIDHGATAAAWPLATAARAGDRRVSPCAVLRDK